MTTPAFKPLRRPHAGRKAVDPFNDIPKRNLVGQRRPDHACERIIRAMDGSFSDRDTFAYLNKLRDLLAVWKGATEEAIRCKEERGASALKEAWKILDDSPYGS